MGDGGRKGGFLKRWAADAGAVELGVDGGDLPEIEVDGEVGEGDGAGFHVVELEVVVVVQVGVRVVNRVQGEGAEVLGAEAEDAQAGEEEADVGAEMDGWGVAVVAVVLKDVGAAEVEVEGG